MKRARLMRCRQDSQREIRRTTGSRDRSWLRGRGYNRLAIWIWQCYRLGIVGGFANNPDFEHQFARHFALAREAAAMA
jgi:hypothetical protein